MVRSGDDKGWIAAHVDARQGDDWSGLCQAQKALRRGMNLAVQRASAPGVGECEYVALASNTYKVTWVVLRKRVPAPA